MSVAAAASPQVLHSLPGRLRVRLPLTPGIDWSARLCALPGVRQVVVNALTGNALVRFDPGAIDRAAILDAIDAAAPAVAIEPPKPKVRRHAPARTGSRGSAEQVKLTRVRIPVAGLERSPQVARSTVERLRRQPSVRHVHASQLTGRLLVEFNERETSLGDLMQLITDLELPPFPGEDHPANPLDPAPLVEGITETTGSVLGLGYLAVRQVLRGAPAGSSSAAQVAAVISLLRGFPTTRNALRRLLGRHLADVVFGAASIASLTLAESPIGLAVQAAEGLRLLTEVLARRRAFEQLEERVTESTEIEPGGLVRLEAGEHTPAPALVREGYGGAAGLDGLPLPIAPGDHLPAGSELYGGPFLLELHALAAFTPEARPSQPSPGIYERYLKAVGPFSLLYAAGTGLVTRSLSRAFQALLLVNPRAAVIGREMADLGASARVLRAGVTVIGTRPERTIRRPDTLLLSSPRVLTGGTEVTAVLPLSDAYETVEILELAAGLATAAGSPWGGAFRTVHPAPVEQGRLDGGIALGFVGGTRYALRPASSTLTPSVRRLQSRGELVLELRADDDDRSIAILGLRPALAPGHAELIDACKRLGVAVSVLCEDSPAARAVARRAGVELLAGVAPEAAIRERQRAGQRVAYLADSAESGAAFAACDLAIGLHDGRTPFPARADVLAADLPGVAAIVVSGARHDAAVRDGTAFSVIANALGAGWGLRGAPGVDRASLWVYGATFGAVVDGWLRLRGAARRHRALLTAALRPHPERWGERAVPEVLAALDTAEDGLSSQTAARRLRHVPQHRPPHATLQALLEQVSSPLTGLLAIGAGVSLLMGAPVDLAIIGATIAANLAVGTWQERRADHAVEALVELNVSTARVLRDGRPVTLPAGELVAGDVILLASGDRVPADARLLDDQSLEVDEAALTGESLPVWKSASGQAPAGRVVLEGSDVIAGSGRAVVVAVGARTHFGATAAALADEGEQESPLGSRLTHMLAQVFPVAIGSGAITAALGLLRGGSPLAQLGLGATLAVTAVPEGLPLLARVSEANVARRLIGRGALVRHLAAVEALGRVDVACTDKTGTLTEGRLRLAVVADTAGSARLPGALSSGQRRVLADAALASPPPGAPGAEAHPTDVAVVRAAVDAGLGDELAAPRVAELPFDPIRAFHATQVDGRLYLKGAPEILIPRCAFQLMGGREEPLDERERAGLAREAARLAGEGLRVLMVAEGAAGTSLTDPQQLVALGFVGINDPLRPQVREAVRRCHEAGIRVVMLTGDHPATARAIGREAGLLNGSGEVVTATELDQLDNGELDARLAQATVIARATPLDKLRIIESLQRTGHTVAMTGDGVNDAPALRLADVGVAMGRIGTEVARQAADIVLAEDDFSSLVEGLVEGRGFWQNTRRALGLLLGGNLGELGLVVGGSLAGFVSPLSTRQILAVNLITDVLPGLAVALQQPEHRHLAGLAREGTAALDETLRSDVWRRAFATGAPALAAYLAARSLGLASPNSIAFSSIVVTQLAQTLDVVRVERGVNLAVLAAIAGSVALLGVTLSAPPLAGILGLTLPGLHGWGLIGLSALAALVLSRLLAGRVLSLPGLGARPKWAPA